MSTVWSLSSAANAAANLLKRTLFFQRRSPLRLPGLASAVLALSIKPRIRRIALVAAVAVGEMTLSYGCGSSSAEPAIPAPPILQFPKAAGADVFLNDDALYLRYTMARHTWVTSRYVLRKDSSFSLQFLDDEHGFYEYRGRYTRDDTLFAFQFNDAGISVAKATGILYGDRLFVYYPDMPSEYDDATSADILSGYYLKQQEVP